MAKKPASLSFADIVMGAEAEVIKQAYEARIKIDDQLAIREEAYRRIVEAEMKVEEILGEEGEFIFPAPPLPVAGFTRLMPASRPRPKKPVVPKPQAEKKESDAEEVENEEVKELTPTAEVENNEINEIEPDEAD